MVKYSKRKFRLLDQVSFSLSGTKDHVMLLLFGIVWRVNIGITKKFISSGNDIVIFFFVLLHAVINSDEPDKHDLSTFLFLNEVPFSQNHTWPLIRCQIIKMYWEK